MCDYLPKEYCAYAFLVSYATMADGNGGVPMGASLQMTLRMEKRFKDLGGKIYYNKGVEKFELGKNYKLKMDGNTNITTDQINFIDLDENGVIKAKVYDNEYSSNVDAAISRTPIIRAKLVQKTTGKVVRVAYIKIQWVRTSPVIDDKAVELTVNDFDFNCNKQTVRTTVQQINEQLYNILGMSKEEFHTAYPYFQDNYKDGDFGGWLDNGITGTKPATVEGDYEIGKDGIIQDTKANANTNDAGNGSIIRNYTIGGNTTYEISWTVSGDQMWEKAGQAVYNYVTFASGMDQTGKLTGRKVVVKLISSVKAIAKSVALTHDADYREAYWNADWSATNYNVNVPNTDSKWKKDSCLYKNLLNQSFKTYNVGDGIYNGIVKLPDINKESVKRMVYFFCKDIESVKKIGNENIEFKVLANNKDVAAGALDNRADTLLARQGNAARWSVIAYIQNNEIKAGNYVSTILAGEYGAANTKVMGAYNLFEYNKGHRHDRNYDIDDVEEGETLTATGNILWTTDATLAKKLLNTAEMFTYIGAYAEICELNTKVKTVNVTFDGADHFKADIIKPVYGENKDGAVVYDAVNFPVSDTDANKKSYIRLEDFFNLYEWRYLFDNSNKNEYLFVYPTYDGNNYKTTGSWHWSYYGTFKITVDPTTITCDIDGNETPIPAGFYVGFDKQGDGTFNPGAVGTAAKTVDIKDPSSNAASGTLVKTEFGVLTYHNNGTKLTIDRHLFVPIHVEYGWGSFDVKVTVTLKATKES